MNDATLMHYGVLGMKWGHRKTRATKQSSKRAQSGRNSKKKQQINKIRKVFRVIGSASIMAITVKSLMTAPKGQLYVDAGKNYAEQYIKKNGTKKVSDIHNDWTWADYAWDEVNRH